ncbi:MAG: 3-deoxy-manno-octulosonate cytidylyltransferase [Pelagibacteraceae bacterium]|nr:3-deoxy-manno-octulosonate cytidylyltransferase [Pelagibacteraceae bacterium]PHX88943.1 MAG: 3-deoxy-manno-octulosonate cytidylyltransferase [Pelagibacteraceae bacterium]
MKTLILIPSRLSATRLPGKPLLKINNVSIISHVFKKAKEANIGDVVVATEDQEILDDVEDNGGQAILTSKNHHTGTDRIYEAFKKLNKNDVDLIMNLQGDEPAINIEDIINLNKKMIDFKSEIGTLASKIEDQKIFENKNVVKVATKDFLDKNKFPEANSFFRTTNINVNIYQHIGIYCYSVQALEKFVKFKQTKNELQNKLEQLRALDNDIKINVALANSSSIGVDTKEDYLALKKIMEYKD